MAHEADIGKPHVPADEPGWPYGQHLTIFLEA
jgi:hypothetical protein